MQNHLKEARLLLTRVSPKSILTNMAGRGTDIKLGGQEGNIFENEKSIQRLWRTLYNWN